MMRPICRQPALLCLLGFAAIRCYATEVPVSTSPIITTIDQTETDFSLATVGSTSSTSTLFVCSDGSCIAISLVSIPIISTETILSSTAYISTIGYNTIYSSVAVSSVPSQSPSTTASLVTSKSPSSSPTQVSSPKSSPQVSLASQTNSSIQKTTTRTSGHTSSQSAGASQTSNAAASTSQPDSSNGGLSTGAKIGIALASVVAFGSAVIFGLWLRRRRSRRLVAIQQEMDQSSRFMGPDGMIYQGHDTGIGGIHEGKFGRHEMEATIQRIPVAQPAAELAHSNTLSEQRQRISPLAPLTEDNGGVMRYEMNAASTAGSTSTDRTRRYHDRGSNVRNLN